MFCCIGRHYISMPCSPGQTPQTWDSSRSRSFGTRWSWRYRAMTSPASITVAGASLTLESSQVEPYVVAPVPVRDALSVAYDVEISGSHQLLFWARDNVTSLELDSEWPHPKFIGMHLSRESGRASGRIHGEVDFDATLEATPRDHWWLCRERRAF